MKTYMTFVYSDKVQKYFLHILIIIQVLLSQTKTAIINDSE